MLLSWPERIRMLGRELQVLERTFSKYNTAIYCTGNQIDFLHNGDVRVASIHSDSNDYNRTSGPMFFLDVFASEADSRANGFAFDDTDGDFIPRVRDAVLKALRGLKHQVEDRARYNLPPLNVDIAALKDL